MDPASAFGLAGTLVQFVSFASDLVSKALEIEESASGAALEVTNLDDVYTKLRDISSDIASTAKPLHGPSIKGAHKKSLEILLELSCTCEEDCSQLLQVVEKLKLTPGKKTGWKSFRAALKTIWNKNKIAELEGRISRSRESLTLQICNVLSEYYDAHLDALGNLRAASEEHALRQTESLNKIESTLELIKSSTAEASSLSHDRFFSSADIVLLEKNMSDLHLTEETTQKQQEICRSLEFDSQPARFRSIPEAHARTFRWLFGGIDSSDTQERLEMASNEHKLEYWLKGRDGIFWVSGKPGSGKSTLMKYVANNPRTFEALKSWAYPLPVITAAHYFWSPGTPMQKSQQGLLQTILLRIYQQIPALIEETCGGPRWTSSAANEAWTVSELEGVLRQISVRPTLKTKFCFFIDGLDEYDGDHLDLCETLSELASSGNVKICLSSRPWNVFEGSFGQDESFKIYMHELTRQDIRNYVSSRLSEHFRWKNMQVEGSQLRASDLIEEITKRAQGVFLWVFLVTKMLRDGLTDYDDVSDLLKRLDTFPTELEPFFRHMLDTVDPIYHQKMAGALFIALGSKQPEPSIVYHFHDFEYADKDYVFKLPTKALNTTENEQIQQMTKRRLIARCRGLLEVVDKRVEFLHRTVADFLRTREIFDYLSLKQKPGFNPELAKMRARTAWIKCSFEQELAVAHYGGTGPLVALLREVLACAARIHSSDISSTLDSYRVLDELEKSLILMASTGQIMLSENCSPDSRGRDRVSVMFRENVLKSGLVGYLDYKLVQDSEYFKSFEKPAMLIILEQDLCQPQDQHVHPEHHFPILRCLLIHGQDPNEKCSIQLQYQRTPWTEFLRSISIWELCLEPFGRRYSSVCDMVQLFLSSGADPNALTRNESTLQLHGSSVSSRAWIDLIVISANLRQCEEIATQRQIIALIFEKKDVLVPYRFYDSSTFSYGLVQTEFFTGMRLGNYTDAPYHQLQLLAELTEKMFLYVEDKSWLTDRSWLTNECWWIIKRTFANFRPGFLAMLKAKYWDTKIKRSRILIELSDDNEEGHMKRKRLSRDASMTTPISQSHHCSQRSRKLPASGAVIDLTED